MALLIRILGALCLFAAASPQLTDAAAQRYVVYPRKGFYGTAQSATAFSSAGSIKTVHMLKAIKARAVDVADEADLAKLLKNPAISHAIPDVRRYPISTKSSTTRHTSAAGDEEDDILHRHLQAGEITPYGVRLIGADKVSLAPNTTRDQLVVCVIDSGVNTNHIDLRAANIDGYNSSDYKIDSCGHGTHVTGTMAAVKGNGKGIVGVAPGIAVYAVKVYSFNGTSCAWSWSSDLLAAAQTCIDAAPSKAKVIINMSLGGPSYSQAEETGFQNLYNNGVLSIAAAGNDGSTAYSYPASYSSVLSVAAVDSSSQLGTFSQQNDRVDIAAPGVGIYSTYKNSYVQFDGTSMATPHVSASAALVWSYGLAREWTNADVRNALLNTTSDLGPPGRDTSFGQGLLNVCRAAKLAGFDNSNTVAC